jgi:FMN phosphatase YigB (HAD superfamily)/DNA-binding XRE family transcriptional regulator
MGDVSSLVLGKALQQARQAAGLTQQELCQKADLSYSTLAKIERGAIKTPSVFTVKSIADVLAISMDGLLGTVVGSTGLAKKSARAKKTSRNGTSFLYLDINGCLVRFFHGAFTKLSHETGVPSDVIESTFWHYNDAVCRGEMAIEEFNAILAKRFGVESIDWASYYMAAVEPIKETHNLLVWAAKNYRVGLLSNIMPGFITEMITKGLLPDIEYDAIIDSSEVSAIKPESDIYKIAQGEAGVDASEILFVDDSRTNLMAAERMGWKVMWFDDYRPAESVARIYQSLE